MDDIQNRIERPELHEIDDNGHDVAARQVFAAITIYICYYIDTNEKEDIRNVTVSEHCQFQTYELTRIRHFHSALSNIIQENISLEIHQTAMMQALFQKTSELVESMKSIIELLGSNTTSDKLIGKMASALVLAQEVLKYLKNINAPVLSLTKEFLSGMVMSGFETPKKLDWNVVTGECVSILRPTTPALLKG